MTDEQKDAIEYLELMSDDLHEPTEEMQEAVKITLDYVAELETKNAAQAAEIERLRIDRDEWRGLADFFKKDGLENGRLRAALEQAEEIRDSLVASADSIGELIFGDYVSDDSGLDRFSADGWTADPNNPEDYDVPPYTEMSIETARVVASIINEMMDVDWVHVDGEIGQ